MRQCKYQGTNNQRCQEADLGNGYCFWHDPTADKSGLHLSERLEDFTRKGGLTQGLQLKRANLKSLNLVNKDSQVGYDLSGSNLYKANLSGAHLFNLVLKDGSLMKANLHDADLHCANLEGTNLLDIKLQGTRLDNIYIGPKLMQEKLATQAWKDKKPVEALDNLEQSEEIYRLLRNATERQGLYGLAAEFGYKELLTRRKQMPRGSSARIGSFIVDLVCGYGEKPQNTIFFSLLLIGLCALGYFFLGVSHNGELLQFAWENGWKRNVLNFMTTLYYSVVTFTTLGYGDITPIGLSRVLAAVEAFLGSFSIALFVVVFFKRMTH